MFHRSDKSWRTIGPAAVGWLALAGAAPAALPSLAPIAPDPQELGCLATAISYEAGNQPQAGQEAVAQVILNRLHDPAFPKSVCGVVFQGAERRTGCQFSFTCDGSMARWRPGRGWPTAQRIAAQALAGELHSPIGAATHYHAAYVHPAWADAMTRVARIGAHIFYQRGTAGLPVLPVPAIAAAPGAAVLSVWGLAAARLVAVGGAIEVRRP